MSAHGHERIHHNDRVKKVEGASQWTRTEDAVLMAIGLVGPTREDLSAAGKACAGRCPGAVFRPAWRIFG
jgi:hypothetical protein